MGISVSDVMADLGDSPGHRRDASLFICVDRIGIVRAFFRVPFMANGSLLLFNTPAGHQFSCSLLKMCTTRPVHDYIVEAVSFMFSPSSRPVVAKIPTPHHTHNFAFHTLSRLITSLVSR
jgi:hypothetical protein